ncbi:RTA1 like protein-domain-containing protein [Aspergillus avenaceus]|uniref:RTA1 like protein-domain-containing protein n=1 Tax=Aspergillus avenaceus TaxID=36643 RepID=A0A5N6U759_ASPAV|nr:RTA1 like protein-domain-containing protein [Aspergillus avenaceus]
MSSGSPSSLQTGQWVTITGLCIQLVFFSAFIIVAFTFHLRISRTPTAESEKATDSKSYWPRDWRGLLGACYFVSVLILIRSVYRVVEFAQGNKGYVISHEAFLYVLDAAMMLLVMLALNLIHPSIVLNKTVRHHRVRSDETVLRFEMGRVSGDV